MNRIAVRITSAVLAFASTSAILSGIAALAEFKPAGLLVRAPVPVENATANAPGTRPTAMAAPDPGGKRL